MRLHRITIARSAFLRAWITAWISASLLAAHGENETHEPGAQPPVGRAFPRAATHGEIETHEPGTKEYSSANASSNDSMAVPSAPAAPDAGQAVPGPAP